MAVNRRLTGGIVIMTAVSAIVAGCSGTDAERPGREKSSAPEDKPGRQSRPIGDGSTMDTGAQPHQPKPAKLKPGEKPPQFVVFSWDGAGEDSKKLFSHFREVGKKYGATQTFFLSGIYLLPESEAKRYKPPGHKPGASDIGYLKDVNVKATLKQIREAWGEGHEIGTHYNGHFCGPTGVNSWTPADWKSEIKQAKWFVSNWKTTTGWKGEKSLPFDYDKELIGGRTPCLEGRANLLPAAKEMGFRYDSSGNGTQVWPDKEGGLWDVPLQAVPLPGRKFETLSMDYNFLANQSKTTNGPSSEYPKYQREMRDGLLQGFNRAYQGNRAPMIIGNHFESWNGGVYMKAVEEVMKNTCPKKEVRCVSFRQLVDWLDVQDPKVLAKLRKLPVGQAPTGGWSSFGGEGQPSGSKPSTEDGDS
ncbi:hypothetical protein [Streptomyces sp. NPDC005438]|uniref:hypothetical protein n=1 Tax=Streptomyces sp. NPDC005438 TaxID=3156880 RepID=UPI0033A1CF57